MIEALSREVNGWVYGAFGAGGLVTFQQHGTAYVLGAALAALGIALAVFVWSWRRVLSRGRSLARWAALMRSPSGRRALTLAREIRAGGRRLRRGIALLPDPSGRRELVRTLEQFVRGDLNQTLDLLQAWLAIGGAIRVRFLERALETEMARWSALPNGDERRRTEQSVARHKQQLALARRATEDHGRLVDGLEEAAAAIRTLEAELLSLGTAREPVLPVFRAQLDGLAEDFRRQRELYLEFQARPG